MKSKLLASAFALLALTAAVRADEYPFKEPFRHTAPFEASGALSLSSVNGNVAVVGWDKNEILIEGEKAAKTKEELDKIDLSIDVSPDHAELAARLPKRSGWFFGNTIRGRVTFTIHLPSSARIEQIDVVNSGVKIDRIHGGATIETVNGGIDASDVRGSVDFETVNGPLQVRFSKLDRGDHLSFETVNGPITVVLPPDAAVDLETEVVNGRIDCDFPLTLTRSSKRKQLSGTIAGGGARLEAETVNGPIRIQRGGDS